MASGESSASEDFTGSENSAASLSQHAHARSIRAAHRIHPYTGRPAARRSLQEVLSPDDIQLAQDSPQFASPTPNATGGGPTSMNPSPAIDHGLSPTQHIADNHQARLNSEKTPPIRRSPRLARLASAGADADTPDAVLTARVGPVGCRSPRLVERRAHAGSRNSGRENATSNAFLYRLIVKPIVKQAVSQRDATGESLESFVAEGSTFSDIQKKLWEKFRENMKGRAVKANGDNWSILEQDINDWTKMMQFKYKRHLIDIDKTEQQWNSWLISLEKEAVVVRVLLYIYEYGSNIATLQVLVSFKKACIDPVATDRAGAASESTLQEIVDQLQQRWSSTFQGAAIFWRMWANDITRNLNRSTWNAAIEQPPPGYVARLLHTAESNLEQRISGMSRSANLVLDCVNAAIAANSQLRQDWEAFGAKLTENYRMLATRKAVIEGFIENVLPPRDVMDPMERMENIPDVDHS